MVQYYPFSLVAPPAAKDKFLGKPPIPSIPSWVVVEEETHGGGGSGLCRCHTIEDPLWIP